jgi:trk system potassium uptake protein TrkH
MPRPRALSLHSKLVLTASAALLVVGAVVLLAVEPRGSGSDWPHMGGLQRVRAAAFQSVSARTAGFNIIDMAELTQTGKLWLCGLMSIGGSPAGTAGGMKTITFVILLMAAYSALRRRTDLEAFRRRISLELFQRVVAVGVLYTGLVVVVTFLLSITMRPQYPLIDLLFEASSACGTVGLSTGVTADLTEVAECVIIGAMFVGRLGPLTLLLAATSHLRKVQYTYATETVVIG